MATVQTLAPSAPVIHADRLLRLSLGAICLASLLLALRSGAWLPFLGATVPATLIGAWFSRAQASGGIRSRVILALSLSVVVVAVSIQMPTLHDEAWAAELVLLCLLAHYRERAPVISAAIVMVVHHLAAHWPSANDTWLEANAATPLHISSLLLVAGISCVLSTPHPATADSQTDNSNGTQDANSSTLEPPPSSTQLASQDHMARALSFSCAGMMIANTSHEIVYANPAVIAILRNQQQELRKAFSDFDPDRLVGTNIHIFHRNPVRVRALLDTLAAPHSSRIQIGDAHFHLNVTPMHCTDGKPMGFVVEWHDRTTEFRMEQDIAAIIDAAAQGHLDQRLHSHTDDGLMGRLSDGINRLLEATSESTNEMRQILSALSRGDLSHRIKRDFQGVFGEMKGDANATAAHLAAIVARIQQTANDIDTSVQMIGSGNEELSTRTEQQATTLEEAASSLDQLTQVITHNADAAQQASLLTRQAACVAQQGDQVVGEVATTMLAIEASSKKIAEIISVIDGISFQTNILALNAAVEAARAGDSGRSFAVVATEVRALAQRSAAAALEIRQLISESVDKVASGSALAERARITMEDIVASVRQATAITADISSASREQSSDISRINRTVAQMDITTRQNAKLVQDTNSATHAMQQQADALTLAISRFQLDATPAPGHRHDSTTTADRHPLHSSRKVDASSR